MAIHRISICLSDIDQSRIVKDKNGKPWLKLTIFESIQQTRLDDNIEVLQSASLEEQENGIVQQRVGRGRTVSAVLK